MDREIEDIGDHCEEGREIYQAREQILQQLAFARPVLDDNEGAQKADQEPRCPEPPRDLERAVDHVEKRRAGELKRLVGDDTRINQNNRQKDQKHDPYDSSREGLLLQQEMRR